MHIHCKGVCYLEGVCFLKAWGRPVLKRGPGFIPSRSDPLQMLVHRGLRFRECWDNQSLGAKPDSLLT